MDPRDSTFIEDRSIVERILLTYLIEVERKVSGNGAIKTGF